MRFEKYKIGNLILIDKTGMTPAEWVNLRQYGIGGSDVSSILDLNPYASITELFYEKVGYKDPVDLTRNPRVFWGGMLENPIVQSIRYYDLMSDDELNYLDNYYMGRVKNNILTFPFIVKHEQYPWMLFNVDAIEVSDKDLTQADLYRMVTEEGRLPEITMVHETKTMSDYVSDQWENGLPIGYVGQTIAYTLPLKTVFPNIRSCIWSLIDGGELVAHPLPVSEELENRIFKKCAKFWDVMREGKVIMSKGLSVSETDHLLSEIAPVPENITPAYNEFLSKILQAKKEGTISAKEEQREWGFKHKMISAILKYVEERQMVYAASIKEYLLQHQARRLEFNEKERISFNKRLFVTLKDDVEYGVEEVRELMKSLGL